MLGASVFVVPHDNVSWKDFLSFPPTVLTPTWITDTFLLLRLASEPVKQLLSCPVIRCIPYFSLFLPPEHIRWQTVPEAEALGWKSNSGLKHSWSELMNEVALIYVAVDINKLENYLQWGKLFSTKLQTKAFLHVHIESIYKYIYITFLNIKNINIILSTKHHYFWDPSIRVPES